MSFSSRKLITKTLLRSALFVTVLGLIAVLGGCGGSGDLIDLGLNPPDRKPIDVSRTGLNNFFVSDGVGSISDQYADIHVNLKLKYVRVLFAWLDSVQPTPNSPVNYDLFDRIIRNLPAGMDVDIVLAHTPSWMANPANWIDGNPRKTWVEKWLRPTVKHFSSFPGIIGYEIWNEPDLTVVPSDSALGLEEPENYVELIQFASRVLDKEDSRRLKIMGATQSIQQNFPTTLNYNRQLRDLGIQDFVDVYNIHYYGKGFESVVGDGGVKDFLNALTLPLWVTESGERGANNQLAYVEQVWGFLRDQVPGIDRIYYFEYANSDSADSSFALRTPDPALPVSDLYVHLVDRAGQ